MANVNTSHARFNPSWRWKTIRTERFTIYYPEGHEGIAKRVAGLSSEVGDDVTAYFGLTPQRCPVILNPGTDLFNGSYEPFPNRITLHEAPDSNLRGFGPATDILDLVYTHEYTHFTHITSRFGVYKWLTQLFGNGLAVTNGVSPLWIIEGVTTNTETLYTDGGRGRSAYFKGIMRSFSENTSHWDLASAGASSPFAPPSGRFYLTGYHMIEYLSRNWGSDAMNKINRYQAVNPLGGSGRAIRKVTGISPQNFYSGFLSEYRSNLKKHRQSIDRNKLPRGNVIAGNSLDDYSSFFWTYDAKITAFRRSYERSGAIVVIDPSGKHETMEIPTGTMNPISVIRPISDGSIISAVSFPHPLGAFDLDVADLVLFDCKRKKHRRFTKNAHILYADESPDGASFAATRRNGMWTDIVLLDRKGRIVRNIAGDPGLMFEKPVWSPDGGRIAASMKNGRNTDIVLIDVQSGEFSRLFKTDYFLDLDPSFSPDGNWIVFSSDRGGVFDIYAWNIALGTLYQLTSVYYHAGQPKISPDGSTLAFTRILNGVNMLCTMPFDPHSGHKIDVDPSSDSIEPVVMSGESAIAVESSGIPFLEAYKPYIHAPWFERDEDGTTGGFMLVGGDPVGITSYRAKLLYGFNSDRPGYDVTIKNSSFWPVLSMRTYDSSWEGNTLNGGRDRWIRERGGEVSANLNIIHRVIPDIVSSKVNLGVRVRSFEDLSAEAVQNREHAVSGFAEIGISRMTETAPRDIGRGWGQLLVASYEKATSRFDADLPGHNLYISVSQWIPSPLNHHSFTLGLRHQSQEGRLIYNKDSALPRGYTESSASGGLCFRKTLTLRSEYSFPIAFTDFGVGMMLLHVKRIKGTLFCDYGGGWSESFSQSFYRTHARTTAGALLSMNSAVFNLPVEFGLRGSYRFFEKEAVVQIVYGVRL